MSPCRHSPFPATPRRWRASCPPSAPPAISPAAFQHVAPPGARTESYSVIISAVLAGTAAGDLAGGALTASSGGRLAFTAAAGGAVAAATWTASRKDTLCEQEENR